MKVTLIQPRLGTKGVKGSMPPLAMGIIARYTPKEVLLQFIDESTEEVPDDLDTDLVAMSVTTLTARRAYDLSAKIRGRGIPVVMGGIHPTLMPEEALKYADCIVKGTAESVWPQVIADAVANKLKRIYTGLNEGPLESLTPDRSIYLNKKYAPITPVQFGRGCPFTCDFCSVHAFYGTKVMHRPVAEVLEEISSLKGKTLFFVDDNIHTYGKGSIDLLKGLSKMNIRWIGQASVNAGCDPEIVKLFRESGCIGLIIGFESMDENSLSQMKKKINIQHDYIKAVKLLQKNHIMVAGSFVFGYDGESAESVKRALDFAEKYNFVHAYFNPLVPTPGTALYDRIIQEDRFINSTWWLSEEFKYGSMPYKTEGMSSEELEGACINARRKFDSYFSIFKRGFSSKANFGNLFNFFFFWLANITYRKEYRRKYGKKIFN